MSEAIRQADGSRRSPPRRGLSGALKLGFVALFLFVTGGPSVVAQFDDSAASYWRQERQRWQARHAAPVKRSVEQRPTRLIRGAAPKKGFTRVVPERPIGEDPPRADAAAAPDAGAPAIEAAARPPQTTGAVLRIAVLGDNIGQQLARGLELTYAETPSLVIARHTRDSSGLVNNRFFDWSEATKKLLANNSEPVDIAVIMLGSNDAQEIIEGKDRHRVRSEPWIKAYRARIEAIVTQFRDRKIPLLWVGMPIMRGERLAAEMLAFNEIYRETVQRAGGVYVDVWEAFTDDRNRFALFGPDVNGQVVKLRAGDGVHFTPAGARKLAHFLESPLKRLIDERRPRADPVVAALAPSGETPARSVAAEPEPPRAPESAPGATPVAVAPPQPAIPAPIVPPERPVAGPVVRLTQPDVAPDGALAVSRRSTGAPVQSAFVQRRLIEGAPIAARPGRADDFSWPRR